MSEREQFSAERPVQRSITNAVPASKPVSPHCPYCGADMEVGRVAVHTIFWRWLTLGESAPDSWFQPRDGSDEEVPVPSSAARRALRCRRCQSILIPGRAFQHREAPEEPDRLTQVQER